MPESATMCHGHPDQWHRRAKAVEPHRVFLNVSLERKKVLADELGSFLILIQLGIQPSTGSSTRSRAEIQ